MFFIFAGHLSEKRSKGKASKFSVDVRSFHPVVTRFVLQMLDVARGQLQSALAKERTLLVMVVGIPNVGKSCLINTMSAITRQNFSGLLFFAIRRSRSSDGGCIFVLSLPCFNGHF